MRRLLLAALIMSLALPLLAWAAPAPVPDAQGCGPDVVHVVSRGENAYRISLRYGTTVRAITLANGLANPNIIYPGQRLLIPCASGVVLPVPTAQPIEVVLPGVPPITVILPGDGGVVVPSPAGRVSCVNFRPTSPTDGMGRGSTTFYWNPASGQVQTYRVNIYNLDNAYGRIVASYTANAPLTHVSGDTGAGAIGEGFRFAWNVEAWADGRLVCATQMVTLYRSSP